jgi:hypothetical protein
MNNFRSQLINLLIGKSLLETIFAATIAVVVFLNVFPPGFKGWGEAVVETRSIAGWAVNNGEPWERVEVQLFIDGKLHGTQVAQLSRPDVSAAGWAKDEWHGYNFEIRDLEPGNHEARVYALHRSGNRFTLQLLGDAVPFVVRGDGKWDHR